MSIPKTTNYPYTYDTEYELKTVVDSLHANTIEIIVPYDVTDKGTYNWELGLGIIDLDSTEDWPDSGFISLYLKEHWGQAIDRATLFHYASKEDNRLLEVTILNGQVIKYFPRGSTAVQNVVAQNHNYNKDAVLALESYLGHRGTDNQSSIEWFTEFFVKNVRKPQAWLSVSTNKVLIGDEIIVKDLTTRINPGFTIDKDPTVQWVFQLGDGIKIDISLDAENQEYVFEITKQDNNGIVKTRTVRKKNWDKKIVLAYQNPGVKNMTLTVINEFGEDIIYLEKAIKVLNQPPQNIQIQIQAPNINNANDIKRAYAIKDQITILAGHEHFGDDVVVLYDWDFGSSVDKESIPNSNYLTMNFLFGGVYDIGLKIVTETDAWASAYLQNAIDIVEKPSVWLAYSGMYSGQLAMNEYAIRANTWKQNGLSFDLQMNFNTGAADLDFVKNKSMHHVVNTNNAILFWASDQYNMKTALYNSINNIMQNKSERLKLYDWYTLYIPEYNTGQVYIFGGLSDINDIANINQEILFYNIKNDLFTVLQQNFVTETLPPETSNIRSYTEAYFNCQELLENSNSTVARFKATNYGGKGYVLKTASDNLFNEFYSFDPAENIFASVSTNLPFVKTEIAFESLRDGLYVISNVGDVHKYNTTSDTWTSTTQETSEIYTELFYTNTNLRQDPNASGVFATESMSTNSSNTNLYFSYDYNIESFGRFNLETLSFQKLSARPPENVSGDVPLVGGTIFNQWGMGVF